MSQPPGRGETPKAAADVPQASAETANSRSKRALVACLETAKVEHTILARKPGLENYSNNPDSSRGLGSSLRLSLALDLPLLALHLPKDVGGQKKTPKRTTASPPECSL
ncbi:hypothetical protein PtA15_9A307 [Puccinia triticina]|uniref:Uncharacterized protein n=1 Tax=Puccinia triticina TaxID=208348 RepID=A0ABY7CZQ1_9BASI|nr:uncharacterized protein PtA15_9A307 [Puccinia triticina]WAQ88182.1 hypothetical protein PtA15_9A307 [Puccinia triticina]WAR60370.1 hypothetical protein PtB15_9B309 [Puccinia triticina]